VTLGVLTLRAITSGANLAEKEGRERLFHRDKACFESNGSQLRTYHAIQVFTEFDLQIVRDSSRKSSLAGDIGHHARAGPHASVCQRLLWPLDPSFGEAAVARPSSTAATSILVQHTMRKYRFGCFRRVTASLRVKCRSCGTLRRNAGRRSKFNRGSGRTPMNPLCLEDGGGGRRDGSTPLEQADRARSARAIDEHTLVTVVFFPPVIPCQNPLAKATLQRPRACSRPLIFAFPVDQSSGPIRVQS
jgi:hypothetical protein